MPDEKWWHGAVVYQIYPRSFRDSNGDGIGDIPGIVEKLDYLEDLGINTIWLCPVCASPMIDNGYDISDYRAINPEFGTLADMERLFAEAGRRGIRVLPDLVLNHTSDKHEWFQKALAALRSDDMQNPWVDYYYFRKGRDADTPPCNWRSCFGGSVWEKVEGTDYWYLHLFAKGQPDLNWENPALRSELYGMINWWMEKGAAGFRIDAVCNIKKDLTFADLPPDGPDGLANPSPSCLAYPGIDSFLSELRDKAFAPHGCFTVAEAAGVEPGKLPLFIGREKGWFSAIFDFSYTDLDIEKGFSCNRRHCFSVKELRDAIFSSQLAVQKCGYGAPYLENHDQNRSPDKYLQENERGYEGITMLGALYFFLQGVPFIYQGQELGMTNYPWKDISEFNDISTYDQYERMLHAGFSEAEAFEWAACRSRDNARTPMLWNPGENAGFSASKPWLPVHPGYAALNAAVQEKNEKSVLHFYKKMIRLRKDHQKLFMYGDFIPLFPEAENLVAYGRLYQDEQALVVCNFSTAMQKISVNAGTVWLGNCRAGGEPLAGEIAIAHLEACVIGITPAQGGMVNV